MNNILLLTKIFLKTSIFRNISSSNQENKKNIFKALGIILIGIYVVAVFGFLSYQMIDMLNQMNQASLFLGLWLLSTAVLILIQAIASSMNLFYFSKDIENVLPLPIKPYQILVAKFNVLLITEYFTVFMFTLIPFIIYGIVTGAGLLFYLYSVLILLVFPIIPALISCLLVMIFMSFSKFAKNKDMFQIISMFLIIFFVIIVQLFAQNNTDTSQEEMIHMLTQANGLVEMVEKYFITLKPAVDTLVNYSSIAGIISFGELLLISILLYLLFIALSQKLYLKGAVGASISGKKSKSIKNEKGTYTNKKVWRSYLKKEMIMLFKNPIYFMQCVLPAFLLPVIFAIVFFAGSDESLKEITQMAINPTVVLCVAIGINTFLLSMIFISVTAISRDGQNAVFMKYIPVPLYKQIIYKCLPSIIISIIPIVFVIVAISYLLNYYNVLFIIYSLIISILISILYSYLMIIVDLKRPKLNWDTEYAVVKQNFNMIFCFAFSIAMIIIICVMGGTLANFDINIVALVSSVVLLFLIYLVDKYFRVKSDRLLDKIT